MLEPDRPTIERFLDTIAHPVVVVARKPVSFAPPIQVLWPVDQTDRVDQILWLAEQYHAVYVNLNPLKDEYQFIRPSAGTALRDVMIARRTRILVDIDAHDCPKEEAERQKDLIKEFVKARFDDTPILETDSGNGYGLIYAADLPKDRDSNTLVKNLLKTIKAEFSCADVSCSNAGRLTRLIGTLNVRDGQRVPTRIINAQTSTVKEPNPHQVDEDSEAA